MSIFRRDPEPAPPKPAPQRQPSPRQSAPDPKPGTDATRIASGSKVVGEISGSADLQIDGHVEGAVRLEKRVTIGPKGRVDGPIDAGSVQVGGKVVGSVYGRERVEVQAGGSLEGDVTSPRVVIDDGAAFFRGKIEMSDKAPRRDGGQGGRPAGGPPAKAQSAPAAGKPDGGKPHSQGGDGGSRDEGHGGGPGHRQPGGRQDRPGRKGGRAGR